jgi:hypothetical protein
MAIFIKLADNESFGCSVVVYAKYNNGSVVHGFFYEVPEPAIHLLLGLGAIMILTIFLD